MKNPYAVALGKKGGKAGTGAAKARTSEQARAAVLARWARRKPKASTRRQNPRHRRGPVLRSVVEENVREAGLEVVR